MVVGYNMKQIFFLVLLLGVSLLPQLVSANTSTLALEPIQNFPVNELAGLNKTGISGSGTSQIQILLGRSIGYVVGFLGSLALCIIIYAGVRFMISRGDEEGQKKSLGMMLWAGIGITALLGSYSLVRFVFGIL